ncbi:hypothetical protein [Endozoicomonas sp. Mp262]|uniref:hypothetical protein n=1 Tax=Endozoicomonas sp. Mp262 TaxID=2919499 RepID=UPI0021DA415E
MSRFIKGLMITLITCLLGWKGLSYYLEKKLTKQLDELIATASGFVNIHYDKLSVHFNGQVSLSRLTIKPLFEGSSLITTVDRVSVTFPNTLYLINKILRESDTSPESLSIHFENLSNPSGIDDLNALLQEYDKLNNALKEHIEPVCGDRFFLTGKDLKALGYGSSAMNLTANYQFNESHRELTSAIQFQWPEIGSLELETKISNIDGLPPAKIINTPRFEKLSLEFNDYGLTSRLTQFCATKAGLSQQDYIVKESSQPDIYYGYTLGLLFNDAMKHGYQDFLTTPGKITLSALPSIDFHPLALSNLPPEYWVENLGLSLQINGKDITPLQLQPGPLFRLLSELQETKKTKTEPRHDYSSPRDKVPPKPSFQVIEKSNISRYINNKARIQITNNQVYEGRVLDADTNQLVIEYWVSGGTATLPIKLDRIESIEIWK